jgi:hypothetical protein
MVVQMEAQLNKSLKPSVKLTSTKVVLSPRMNSIQLSKISPLKTITKSPKKTKTGLKPPSLLLILITQIVLTSESSLNSLSLSMTSIWEEMEKEKDQDLTTKDHHTNKSSECSTLTEITLSHMLNSKLLSRWLLKL